MNVPAYTKRVSLLCAVAVAVVCGSASAAQAAPSWGMHTLADSTVAPEGQFTYLLDFTNYGETALDGAISPIVVTGQVPLGLKLESVSIGEGGFACTNDDHAFHCESSSEVIESYDRHFGQVVVSALSSAVGTLTSSFEVHGGDVSDPSAGAVDPIRVSSAVPPFGVDAFDTAMSNDVGGLETQAGGHPFAYTTALDLNTHSVPEPLKGIARPIEPLRTVNVSLPAGMVADSTAVGSCLFSQLANGTEITATPECPPQSQVGTVDIRTNINNAAPAFSEFPVFALEPGPSAPLRMGFNFAGSVVVFDADVDSLTGYRPSVTFYDVPTGVPASGSTVTIWGNPASAEHTQFRHCAGLRYNYAEIGHVKTCASPDEGDETAFLRAPTSCQGPTTTSVSLDSWFHPGVLAEASTVSHLPLGYPYPRNDWGPPQGQTGCESVPFDPSVKASLTTDRAGAPSGLDVAIHVPQSCWQEPEAPCESDLRDTTVALPKGVSLNPSSASGLATCSPAQVGLLTPVSDSSAIRFDESVASCPDASKLGDVTIETPLLSQPLKGSMYLAKQTENPFGSLLAMYLVVEGSGVRIKQAGEIVADPASGQLTTRFLDAPQLPFSDLRVELFGGSKAPLRTPAACGTYATQATLTPWSGNAPVSLTSPFEITQGCGGGFDPKLTAGTQNPLAGSFSPFSLRLTREDGTQELAGLGVTLPKGLIGAPKGIAYCPDSVLAGFPAPTVLGSGAAQEASPSCPAGSRVGTVTVGAGAGPNPFYTASGRAYLAGPYKGAPLSLAVVAPAVAGPFDLGTVLVRNAIHVDPVTTQISVASDPLPSVLHGIPLDLRDVRVDLNRADFTLNPTSCEPAAVTSTVTSTQGATANPSSPFQAANCDKLGFKPKLALKLSGKTHRSAYPALRATLTMPKHGANIARAAVTLPKTEILEQAHIKTICTRVQYAAGACPKGAIYGYARAWSPLLDQPLQGPVYLRSSSHPLPDLVASLDGQIHVDLVGRIDSTKARIRNTFELVPDAPVSKFVLTMQGGKKGLLVNNTELCRTKPVATALFDGQNGKIADLHPLAKADCGAKKGKRK